MARGTKAPPLGRMRAYLANSLQLKEAAIGRYEASVRRWWAWCGAHAVDPWSATEEDALQFAAWLGHDSRRAYAPVTLGHFFSCLRGFYEWADTAGLVFAPNPFRRVKGPRQGRRLPKALTTDEAARMIAAFDRPSPRDLRDRAILCVLYASGCRVSELCGLRLRDLDLDHSRAIVRGSGNGGGAKGDNDGVVFLAGAEASLRAYLDGARTYYDRQGAAWVFLGQQGERMHRSQVQDVMDRGAKASGIIRHVTPHMWRHSCATHLLTAGMDIRIVQEVLRHRNLATTQIYTHLVPEQTAREHAARHPLAAQR